MAQQWEKDFIKAQTLTSEKNCELLLVFSGSDWCAPCIKMEKRIWESQAFKSYASDNLVLVKADFPRKKKNKLSDELTAQNKELAEKYNPQGNFPLVVLLNSEGEVINKSGYTKKTAAEYVGVLASYRIH